MALEDIAEHYEQALHSDQKSNKLNWLELPARSICSPSCYRAHGPPGISKAETVKICRQGRFTQLYVPRDLARSARPAGRRVVC